MRSRIVAGLLVVGTAGVLGAQAPMGAQRGGAPAAQMLLANTGRLQLTDQQVVRLAAIARRSDARRQAMRASFDSARVRFGGRPMAADSASRRQFADRMRTDMQRAREQEHADRRDAIAVLTADQQARAWEMIATRGRMMRGMPGRDGARRMRAGEMPRGMRPMRPPMGRGSQQRRPIR